MRVLFALPGLHRYDRGAEIAFISIARQLATTGDDVTLIGSGPKRAPSPYRFLHAASVRRENFESCPSMPMLRNEYAYEELTFVPDFLRQYRPGDFDVTLTCNYPFCNWMLRRPAFGGRRPPHVFVTENGDWPAQARNSEYRFFGCEGLVCTNPEFFERNQDRWRCALIPNGVDCDRFSPGPPQRSEFGLPDDRPIVLMVSALIASKRVEAGIEAVSQLPGAHLVVAGDGPLRRAIEARAAERLPGRFTRVSVPAARMPALYRSADVFLHLSLDEPFGNVFLEAMATGLPMVAHKSRRLEWIVGHDEPLVDTRDRSATVRSIEMALQIPPAERQGRATKAAAYAWPKIGEMYRDFLKQVVAATGPSE
jgi:glycosyltransferase involved in cell wall biosynthesis